MKYRCLRKRDTGEWLNVLLTVDGDTFAVPPEFHQADIAKRLGLPSAALEVVDADADSRSGVLLALPSPPPSTDPKEIREARIKELLAVGRANWTADQRAEVMELLLQRGSL